MKLEKISEDKKNNSVTFFIKGANDVFANTLRRLILEEVPTLAVEDLEIKENSSALFDEMLGLRLGLLPVKTDLKSYRLPQNEAEVEERAASCTLQINLKSSKKGYVYAGDAKSSDPKCTFAQEKAPIVKLLAKQKLEVTMFAVIGQGKTHSKWSPGIAFYRNEPVIKVGKVKDAQVIANKCSDGVFSLKSGKLTVSNEKAYTSKLLRYYEKLDKGISIEYTDNIVFTLESWGQLQPKEILKTSAHILIEKAEALAKEI